MRKDEDRDIILANKQQGETMGELVKRVRRELDLSDEEKITFAGRLDPMASGLVIFLYGEERFKREDYLNLDKEYEFEVILGVKTDTADPLGLIEKIDSKREVLQVEKIKTALELLKGRNQQTYPSYSSKHVGGKALFTYAREGREVPKISREVMIYDLKLKSIERVEWDEIIKDFDSQIQRVKGDFRQPIILKEWKEAKEKLPKSTQVLSCKAKVSSGTYIRVLAERAAAELGTVGIAHKIQRTKVGLFTK